MKLIVAGSRHRGLSENQFYDLAWLCEKEGVTQIVTGCATGVDASARHFARDQRIDLKVFKAEWDNLTADWAVIRYDRYGRPYNSAAGPHRNAEMARHADAVVLFPGGKGTQSMHDEAKRAGILIFDWRDRR